MSGLLYNMDRKMKWVFSPTALLELKKAVFSCLPQQFRLVGLLMKWLKESQKWAERREVDEQLRRLLLLHLLQLQTSPKMSLINLVRMFSSCCPLLFRHFQGRMNTHKQ
jgi:hypothetical protein